jgi:two-component SAPR family response regulator
MKTLVIDSNKTYLNFIKNYLSDNKYNKIDTVTNPLEAVDYIKNNKYDLIICDILMDNINGVDFLENVKKINSNVKIIVHTNSFDLNYRKIASVKGVYNYYLKPSYPEIKRDINILSRGLDNFIK